MPMRSCTHAFGLAALVLAAGCGSDSDSSRSVPADPRIHLVETADDLIEWQERQIANGWYPPDNAGLLRLESAYDGARTRALDAGLLKTTVVPWTTEQDDQAAAMSRALRAGTFKVHWRDVGAEDVSIRWQWDPDSGDRTGLKVWSYVDTHDLLVSRVTAIRDAPPGVPDAVTP